MKIRYVFLVLAFFVAIGFIGDGDYQDQLAMQEHYCEQVQGGHWPDYKNIAEEVCK